MQVEEEMCALHAAALKALCRREEREADSKQVPLLCHGAGMMLLTTWTGSPTDLQMLCTGAVADFQEGKGTCASLTAGLHPAPNANAPVHLHQGQHAGIAAAASLVRTGR